MFSVLIVRAHRFYILSSTSIFLIAYIHRVTHTLFIQYYMVSLIRCDAMQLFKFPAILSLAKRSGILSFLFLFFFIILWYFKFKYCFPFIGLRGKEPNFSLIGNIVFVEGEWYLYIIGGGIMWLIEHERSIMRTECYLYHITLLHNLLEKVYTSSLRRYITPKTPPKGGFGGDRGP